MFALTEWHLYGSSRLGVHKPMSPLGGGAGGGSTGRELVHIEFEGTWNQYTQSFTDTGNTTTTTYQMSYDYFTVTRGEKNYEMVNHLGNVLVIISDKKLKTCEGDTVNYYMADVLQATDYSAFHATLKDRVWYADATKKYRFGGSNGQERDDEVSGEACSYSAEFWQYSPDLGRRFNVDPKPVPSLSVYSCFANNPIAIVDIKGDSGEYYDSKGNKLGVSHDKLPNAIVVIPDDKLAQFNAAMNVVNAKEKQTGNKNLRNGKRINELLRSFGKSYLVDDYWKFYDEHSKDYHNGKEVVSGESPPKILIDENNVQINDRNGVMKIEGKPNRGNPVLSSPLGQSTAHLHTHPNEGQRLRSKVSGEYFYSKIGVEAFNQDKQNSPQVSGTGYFDIGVTKTTIGLYNHEGVKIFVNRSSLFRN